jgi:hypothetical protein
MRADNFSLYVCRHADKESKSHISAWETLRPLFDAEIAACDGGNYEFSTLCGAYLANIEYLSASWLNDHVNDIFPLNLRQARNFDCAMQGVAYMPQVVKSIYELLKSHGVWREALVRKSKGRFAREKLLQQISVAYLWGNEDLNDPEGLMTSVLNDFSTEDIEEIVRFLWGVHGEGLKKTQIDRVIAFWAACMEKVDDTSKTHRHLLSQLALFAAYLEEITEPQKAWLLRIGKTIEEAHNGTFFMEYMEKLADESPQAVGEIVRTVVSAEKQYMDFENRFESVIKKLIAAGFKRLAGEICYQLSDIPEIDAIYREQLRG